jgi:hypothetical protein
MRTLFALLLLCATCGSAFIVAPAGLVRPAVPRTAVRDEACRVAAPPKAFIGWSLLTAVNVVKHAAGIEEKMVGGGLFSFIKYENRAYSVASTALLAAGATFVAIS